MNICYLHSADFRELKGSSLHVKGLIRYLSRLHAITLVVDTWDNSPLEGVHIVELNCPRPLHVVWRALLSVMYTIRILLVNHIDLLYAKSVLEGTVAIIVGRIFRIPSIYEVNGLIVEEHKMKNEKFSTLVSFILEWFCVNYADHLICVTPWIKENLSQRGISHEKMTVIENGTDATVFKPVKDAKKILGLAAEKQYVGYTGTLKVWQGLDHVLDAVPGILRHMPDTEVLIVGGGELRGWLLHSIKEKGLQNVVATGRMKHEEVPLYISACDVCLLLKKPLSSGYSPLKLYEYSACKRPVVASRVKGFEWLEKEKAGILVNQENPQEVADAVVALLKDKALREDMGERGREYVLKYHTWEKIAQKISKTCQQTVNDQGRPLKNEKIRPVYT
jgi:glycosyltransferase involved in cell wall biosynthesis